MKKIIIALIVLAIIGAAVWYFFLGRSANGITGYKTAKADKGTVIKTVSSSGVVQPLQQVQVGTQVNGPIKKLYVDFNSRVKEGDLIAQIDPATYQARVTQSTANLTSSIANVKKVEATLNQSKKELERSNELAKRELISESELDAAVASYDSLLAQLEVAKASVAQSQASLNDAEISLSYTTIKSPIDGVVISRNVDEGQTVVASFSAATLFVIANNLANVQIQASVAESDIGKIALKQLVRFTVDAYPDNKFTGRVEQIRLSPTTVSNVVTYTVIIYADNPGEKLLPGMTATLSFEVEKHDDVLRIPNAALRFMPPEAEMAKVKILEDATAVIPSDSEALSGTAQANGAPGTPEARNGERRGRGGSPRNKSSGKEGQVRKQIWVLDNGNLKPVSIIIGITDGSFTEVLKGDIAEGQDVVTGTIKKGEEALVNPFMPQFPGRRR
ncbi:MAG TPA: efflux RND transporter periplasmic adaptor subunit [Planctomycetota bacterium]|nr:efflux RND transporter periplasmic adaptor subunit [Planctomycetota bacterium]